MDTPTGGVRDSRFSMGYNMSILNNESSPEIYSSSVHSRASTSITSGLSRTLINNNNNNCSSNVQRGLKRTSDMCYDHDGRSSMTNLTGDCGSDNVDEGYSPSAQKGSPPSNGKKTKGRVKIKMEYIDNKLRRYTTFSKRKTGIMKKAYELSTLTGTQVMLLVASETGHVYTFATRKLQPMITSEAGKALIQTCLNSPDPCPSGAGDQRMSATGFEETELSYNIGDDEQKVRQLVYGGSPHLPSQPHPHPHQNYHPAGSPHQHNLYQSSPIIPCSSPGPMIGSYSSPIPHSAYPHMSHSHPQR